MVPFDTHFCWLLCSAIFKVPEAARLSENCTKGAAHSTLHRHVPDPAQVRLWPPCVEKLFQLLDLIEWPHFAHWVIRKLPSIK